MARLDSGLREQLDWLHLTPTPTGSTVTCHPHPLCGAAFGGPIAPTPDLVVQLDELADSGLLGTLSIDTTAQGSIVRLWATPAERKAWEARIRLARTGPAARAMLAAAGDLKVTTWRRELAVTRLREAMWLTEATTDASSTDLRDMAQVARATFYRFQKARPDDYDPTQALAALETQEAPVPTETPAVSAAPVQPADATETSHQETPAPPAKPEPDPTHNTPQTAESTPEAHPTPKAHTGRDALPATGGEKASRVVAEGGFAGPAVVVDVDRVGLPDGSEVELPWELRHWGDVAALAAHFHVGWQVTKSRAESGQVWVTSGVLAQMGIDLDELPGLNRRDAMDAFRDLTRGTAAVKAAVNDGWQVGGGVEGAVGRWTRMTRGTQRVLVAQLAVMDPTGYPVTAGDPTPGQLAARLAEFCRAYGFPLKLSPQTTMHDYLAALKWADQQVLFAPSNDWLELGGVEDEVRWSRLPTDDELALPYLHGYDRGGSYLSGISGGMHFGIGKPTHHDGDLVIGRNTVALCRISAAEADREPLTWVMPTPLFPSAHARMGESVWRSSTTIAYARELGYDVPVLEAWVWRETGPIFETWYKAVSTARTRFLDPATPEGKVLLDQLKTVYTRGIGQMGSDESAGQPHFAPERRWQILARARNNLQRKVVKIGESKGVWPLAWDNDTIVYPSNNPDPVAAWPGDPSDLGRGVGKLRWEGSTMLRDHLSWLTGDGWSGKGQLTKDWNPEHTDGADGVVGGGR
ncbi:hypothetical protein [Luteococcus sp.]|uniref:hypothetical protein n=1 Tax=Luteococcus sp. TaxID=1969402 RepID=UPI0037364F16